MVKTALLMQLLLLKVAVAVAATVGVTVQAVALENLVEAVAGQAKRITTLFVRHQRKEHSLALQVMEIAAD